MNTDADLLRQFVGRRGEYALSELVNRHMSVVYSAACCETQGDLSSAQDVTRSVFIELVHQAASLQKHPTLAGLAIPVRVLRECQFETFGSPAKYASRISPCHERADPSQSK